MTDEILVRMETRKKAKNTPAYESHNKEIKKNYVRLKKKNGIIANVMK